MKPLARPPAARDSPRPSPTLCAQALLKFRASAAGVGPSDSDRGHLTQLLAKATSITEKYLRPKPWLESYLPGGEYKAPASETMRCDHCSKSIDGEGGVIIEMSLDYPIREIYETCCPSCAATRCSKTPVSELVAKGLAQPAVEKGSDDGSEAEGDGVDEIDVYCQICSETVAFVEEDLCHTLYAGGETICVCDDCYPEIVTPAREGDCKACGLKTRNGHYHMGEPELMLCPNCFGAAEKTRLEAQKSKFSPTGFSLKEKPKQALLKNLIMSELLVNESSSPDDMHSTVSSLLGEKSLFSQLTKFLEAQLAPSFAAFKLSTAWKGFSIDASAPGSALALVGDASEGDYKPTFASPLENPDAQLANVSASDSYADYEPAKLDFGPPHVEHVVESASLACVAPTDVTYQLALPAEALSSGVLSRVQLEAVVYALQQQEKHLPRGARAGFFIGDGTGVGKGRELAAIVWENWLRGRKRACWFTCNNDLVVDARRDLDDIGASDIPLRSLTGLDAGRRIADDFDEGVLLVTYSCLVASSKVQGRQCSRYRQLLEWLEESAEDGASYDGVLAFDEAHKAKGAAHDQPVGMAVVELQRNLPDARVVYLSATGATQVKDMAYMERLGLWGPGTYFKDFQAIEATLYQHASGADGAAGALEMFAVQLKSSGAYVARSLGLRGVDFHLEVAKLSEEQTKLYDACANFWIDIWRELKEFEPPHWEGTFTSAQVKFFQQLILSFKVPEICRHTRMALRAGKCVVIGLQSTGDSAVKESMARAARADGGGGGSLGMSQLVSAAREVVEGLLDTLSNSVDKKGSYTQGVLFGYLRHRVKQQLDALNLPAAALDELVNYFGPSNVAEMTGRSHRLLKETAANGREQYVLRARAEKGVPHAKMNVVERQRFQSGEKLIAILSDAGATGFSLHADKTQPNQRRRLHIVPELGWSASKIVQQFGRTHRTNQLMPPEYLLLTCECAGESLTGSAVARKLEGLGALTKGDKTAGRGETAGSLGTNLETSVGLEALKQLRYRRKDPLSFSVENVEEIFVLSGTSLELTSKQYQVLYDIKTVKVFLTRLQLLPVGHQQAMLRFFLSKMRQTDNAMALQSESNSVKVVRETVVFQNPANTAEKVTVAEIECDHSCSWQTALDLAVAGGGKSNIFDPRFLVGFFCNRGDPTYQIFLVLPVDAARVKVVFPFRFSGGFYPPGHIVTNCFKLVDPVRVRRMWEQSFAQAVAASSHLERFALVNGSVFSIWYNMRKALDPEFNPDHASSSSMREELADSASAGGRRSGGRGAGGRSYTFQPNVKIQLLTTSDGKKRGGIRLNTVRPLRHCDQASWSANPACNKHQAFMARCTGCEIRVGDAVFVDDPFRVHYQGRRGQVVAYDGSRMYRVAFDDMPQRTYELDHLTLCTRDLSASIEANVACRRQKCMVEGHSEVDKLEKSLDLCKRTLH